MPRSCRAGLKPDELGRQTRTFPKDGNMRIELVKLLLSRPDVLFAGRAYQSPWILKACWLEQYLNHFPGALLVISHDRTFLDNVTQRTIEISLGKIFDYKAPYSQYLELRKECLEQQTVAWENQQRTIERQKISARSVTNPPVQPGTKPYQTVGEDGPHRN